jgi:hypothetical protein
MNDEFSPYTSLWGKVDNVREAPRRKGCIELSMAGQRIILERASGDGLEKLGLLGPPKKRERFFLIIFENKVAKKHAILAGWKNPPDMLVRRLQPLVLADSDFLYHEIAHSDPYPTWKDFEVDEFVEVQPGHES